VITQPRDELTRWQKTVRFMYDLGRYGARQLRQDDAPRMAAALSYRTLFGLLPVLVVGTMIVRAIGGFEQLVQHLGEFFSSLSLDEYEMSAAGGAALPEGQSLSQWLLDIVRQVEDVNLAAITWVGVFVLIYSAVSLMVTIEGCFNNVCRAPEGRSWLKRLPIYWTIVTIGPAAIALTMYVDSRFNAFIAQQVSWWWMLKAAPVLWSFIATWLVMFAVYRLLPNTAVHVRPALIGALVAAVLLEIGKRTMGAYIGNALSIRQLYGSLGLIPLFMFWVYLMWLVVLFGLEVSATLQSLGGRTLEEVERKRRPTGLVDPASVLTVMEVIAERFGESAATSTSQITEATGLAEATVQLIVQRLIEAGLVHRLDREDGAVSLARPPERIAAGELIEVGFALVDEGGMERKPAILLQLRDAQRSLAARATLAALLPAQPVAAASDKVTGS
jgi:membrane protein